VRFDVKRLPLELRLSPFATGPPERSLAHAHAPLQ
jgi:hypothetical protein